MTTLTDAVEGLEASLGDPCHDEDTGFAVTLVADENVVSLFEGGTNLFWAERYHVDGLRVDGLHLRPVLQLV